MAVALIAFALAASSCNRPAIRPDVPIDTTLGRSVDVTGDGEADDVLLHLDGLSSYTPIHWTLDIQSRGQTIYHHQSDDRDIDTLFSDPTNVGNCKTYLECKRRYYLEKILAGIVEPAPSEGDAMFDASYPGSIYQVAREFLIGECGKPRAEAEKIVQGMVDRLLAGTAMLLRVPRSPVEDLPPLMYCPEVRRFVPVAGE